MNFVIRAATGLVLTAVTLALIAGGMWRVMDSRSDSDSRRSRDKTVRAPWSMSSHSIPSKRSRR